MNDEIIVDNKKGEKIMTNEEILLLTKRTLSRGEMVDFLQGKGIYHCTPNKYLPAYIPTDFERILKQGILAYYEKTMDDRIIKSFESALTELCYGDVVQIWIAYSYFAFAVMVSNRNNKTYGFNTEEIRSSIERAILINKEKLKECKEWNGWNNEDGLWQEIERTNGVIKEKYDYTIIRE